MPDDLLLYYERELSFLRQMGAEFAAKYPMIASRLVLGEHGSEDPHVERLLQGFAFLAARVHHKLDDEFPELTNALLGVLYPHYVTPIPSMSIVQFIVDPGRGKLASGHLIPRGTMLYSQRVDDAPCRFQTCYPVTLWPLQVVAEHMTDTPDRMGPFPRGAVAAIRLVLRCLGGTTWAELELDRLRFYLHGETPLVHALYESLLNNACQVQLRGLGSPRGLRPIVLSPNALRPVGFAADEGMLPYTPRSFLGYRLLQEYFVFPEKFLFVDLCELDRAAQAGFRDGMEVLIFLDDRAPRLERALNAGTFRLGCTPIVNLFNCLAEPIRVHHTQTEYRVIPDIRRQHTTEVYTIEAVTGISPQRREPLHFQPFYAVQHATDGEQQPAFWYAVRRPSPRQGDAGTEVYLSLVGLNFQPAAPTVETLSLDILCTNRDLPGRLPYSGEQGYFDTEEVAPLIHTVCLKKPTGTLRPPLGKGAQWRLISHLSLNYLSICDGGREALQEILRLYNFSDSVVIRQHIAGMTDVRSRRVVGRTASMPWNGYCRGLEVTIEFDEQQYVGSGLFLFASVLETFLGLYVSLNSFSQLVATTQQREKPLKRWPPRTGEQILL